MNNVIEFYALPEKDLTLGSDVNLTAEDRAVLDRIKALADSGEDLDTVLNNVFDWTRGMYPCDRVSVTMVDRNAGTVTARWARADYADMVLHPGYSERYAGSSLESIIEEGKIRIIRDLEQYGREHPDSRSTAMLVREGVRSNMTCPMYEEKKPFALFFRSSRQPNAYTGAHIRLHWAIASRLARAVARGL